MMSRKLFRRALALAGAVGLCLACAAPAFAEETEWEYLKQTRVGTNYAHSIITRPSVRPGRPGRRPSPGKRKAV